MKYFVLALLVAIALADEDVSIENAAFPINNMMNMQRIGYSVMGNTMYSNPMFIPKPPQKAIDHYNSLSDDDFPVDYSMSCSNTCGCRQTCVMMWWVPCSCMCPPPCPETSTVPPTLPQWQPPRFPRPEPVPTQPPQWFPRPGPEPILPQQPWQQPPQNPQFPSFPNLNIPRLTTTEAPLTHAPQPWPTNTPTWNQPPVWRPEPQPEPQWPWQNNPQPEPIWPQPQPEPQWPWQNNPQPEPIWPQPQPEPQWPWQNNPQPQPEPQWPWQQQPIQPIVPLPEPLPPTNNWNNNNNNNQFPNHWPQQPSQPIAREDCSVCNSQCSCTPCSVIWVCPTPCPASCCNGQCARHFEDANSVYQKEEEVKEIADEKNSNKIAFQFIPQYLQDIFVPGMI